MVDFAHRLQALRHEFHQNPELGFQEEWTKVRIARHLRDLGIEIFQYRQLLVNETKILVKQYPIPDDSDNDDYNDYGTINNEMDKYT